ncbi:dienelactone hydrolase family protein [Xanthobacter sp. DSM 24535]|uniref:dienelactone hydrolase family protein n=1 Tax=Roseixanthobacter psychrophilus TaxID=3119917 RepID=UPI00372AFEA1
MIATYPSLGNLVAFVGADGAQLAAYHVPAQGAWRGGLVLIQEIFGLTTHIREQCDRFARHGFEVLAPAIFDREAPGLDLSYSAEDIAQAMRLVHAHSFEQTLSDVERCVDWLASSGPVVITGYCYGGSAAWATAVRSDRLVAAACYYGSMIPSQASNVPRCPTLIHFGRNDAEIPLGAVETFTRARPDVDVQLYPAGHGFNSDRRDDYHGPSSELAFERTIALFSAHTGGGW